MRNKLRTSSFETDGFLIQPEFFNVDLIEGCFESILAEHSNVVAKIVDANSNGYMDKRDFALEDGSLKYLKHANLFFPVLNKLISSKLHRVISELLDDDVFIEVVELHQKFPGASETPPHQDNFYFCLKDGKSVTAYVPLNAQTKDNGGLAVIPGSHVETLEHKSSKVIGFSSGISMTHELEQRVSHYTLKPGDLSVHHCNIIHLAPRNSSNIPRVNLAIRFQAISEEKDDERVKRYRAFLDQSARTG